MTILTEATVAQYELLSTPAPRMVRAGQGEFTKHFEEFTFTCSLSLVLEEVCERLGLVHDNERFLPSHALDVKLHHAVERLGEGGPPLRTVHRRLQKLVNNGVLLKRGARKNAVYSLVAPVEG